MEISVVGLKIRLRPDPHPLCDNEMHQSSTWLVRIARKLTPRRSVSILFEQHSRERSMSVMRLFAEGTFDSDSALKDWLEKAGSDKVRKARLD